MDTVLVCDRAGDLYLTFCLGALAVFPTPICTRQSCSLFNHRWIQTRKGPSDPAVIAPLDGLT
jgi:hypothetical protein